MNDYDSIYRSTDGLLTWAPEVLYKHVRFIAPNNRNPDTLYESISCSFYTLGVSVIDEASYKRCFNGVISEANATFEKEKDHYVESVEVSFARRQAQLKDLERAYRRTPDLDKPEFVLQMGWKVAREAELRAKQAEEDSRETVKRSKKQIEEVERLANERIRHEEGRRKNLGDPKHQRKLLRQAKKRRRKGG